MSRILIVEDDEDIAELERDYLEANGLEAEIASEGPTGLSKALSGSFDAMDSRCDASRHERVRCLPEGP